MEVAGEIMKETKKAKQNEIVREIHFANSKLAKVIYIYLRTKLKIYNQNKII